MEQKSYLMKIDGEVTVVLAKNIPDALDKVKDLGKVELIYFRDLKLIK